MVSKSWIVVAVLAAGFSASVSFGQQISTVAGMGRAQFAAEGGKAASAQIFAPQKAAVDGAGNLYFSDSYYSRVFKVTPAGVISTVAGSGEQGFDGDGGPATAAQLDGPMGVAFDAKGNALYIADANNDCIRKVTFADGKISTIAGNGSYGFSGDGQAATQATLDFPADVAVDNNGVVYIADASNNRIRKVANGIISTVAGNGSYDYTGDGKAATAAALAYPEGIAVDPSGTNLYIADEANEVIRKVVLSTGIISTYAGTGDADYTGDGSAATKATLWSPAGVALDAASGILYIADYGNKVVRKVTVSSGIISTYAGNGDWGVAGDNGAATLAQLGPPEGVAVDASGNVYITALEAAAVRKVTGSTIGTVAGIGPVRNVGDGGAATAALLLDPEAVAYDSAGNMYIADSNGNRVRKVTPNGTISTVAGNGFYNTSGDGAQAASAQLQAPTSLAVDSANNLYIGGDYYIRKVTPAGAISTVASKGLSALGTSAAVAVDSTGTLYVADPDNCVVRKVTSAGAVSVFAGNGNEGYTGDGKQATAAELDDPSGVAVDSQGNVYISDDYQSVIRKVNSAGVISTYVGTGLDGCSGDGGPAAKASISSPENLAVDSAGNLYIADIGCGQIRMVKLDGAITTIAGTGDYGFAGDGGLAINAQLDSPGGVAVDSKGNAVIADSGNERVRALGNFQITPAGVVNAASFQSQAGAIAPGEMITIFGTNIGPATGVTLALDSSGKVSNQLAQTQVLIGNTAAALIYVSSGQVSALVPYGVAGQSNVTVQISYQGQMTNQITVPVVQTAPGIFTLGGGQGAVLNQNNTVNSASNPAAQGSVVQIFATGEGVTSPASVDGQLATSTFPSPVAPLSVTIGGQSAAIQFKGTAPYGVAGFLQVNATVPNGIASGNVPLVLTIGTASSQSGVTIAVR